jgi:hypothetical protein
VRPSLIVHSRIRLIAIVYPLGDYLVSPITISDQEIVDIYNNFDDEQRANLELYCDMDSVELNGVKYRKHYSEHEVTPTAKSAPDRSNVAPSIIPTTINFAVEPRETLAEVVKRTINHHSIPSSIRGDLTNNPAIIKAATQDFMSPMSNERGQVYESGMNVAQWRRRWNLIIIIISPSSSTSSSSSSSSESERKKKKKKKNSEKSVKTAPFVETQNFKWWNIGYSKTYA